MSHAKTSVSFPEVAAHLHSQEKGWLWITHCCLKRCGASPGAENPNSASRRRPSSAEPLGNRQAPSPVRCHSAAPAMPLGWGSPQTGQKMQNLLLDTRLGKMCKMERLERQDQLLSYLFFLRIRESDKNKVGRRNMGLTNQNHSQRWQEKKKWQKKKKKKWQEAELEATLLFTIKKLHQLHSLPRFMNTAQMHQCWAAPVTHSIPLFFFFFSLMTKQMMSVEFCHDDFWFILPKLLFDVLVLWFLFFSWPGFHFYIWGCLTSDICQVNAFLFPCCQHSSQHTRLAKALTSTVSVKKYLLNYE